MKELETSPYVSGEPFLTGLVASSGVFNRRFDTPPLAARSDREMSPFSGVLPFIHHRSCGRFARKCVVAEDGSPKMDLRPLLL
jgi:hypothetical protein